MNQITKIKNEWAKNRITRVTVSDTIAPIIDSDQVAPVADHLASSSAPDAVDIGTVENAQCES